MSNEVALREHIGRVLRAARKSRDWTQADVAEQLGLSCEYYARLDRGHALPSLPVLVQMAAVLGIRPEQLLLLGQPTFTNEGDGRADNELVRLPDRAARRAARMLRDATPGEVRIINRLLTEMRNMRANRNAAGAGNAAACRQCGCTQQDCRQCIEASGEPCYWVEPDLCSRCADEEVM